MNESTGPIGDQIVEIRLQKLHTKHLDELRSFLDDHANLIRDEDHSIQYRRYFMPRWLGRRLYLFCEEQADRYRAFGSSNWQYHRYLAAMVRVRNHLGETPPFVERGRDVPLTLSDVHKTLTLAMRQLTEVMADAE
jgi:hypothetical protein